MTQPEPAKPLVKLDSLSSAEIAKMMKLVGDATVKITTEFGAAARESMLSLNKTMAALEGALVVQEFLENESVSIFDEIGNFDDLK